MHFFLLLLSAQRVLLLPPSLSHFTGRDEIERAARVTADALAPANRPASAGPGPQALVVRLYAGLPTAAQMKALAPTPAVSFQLAPLASAS